MKNKIKGLLSKTNKDEVIKCLQEINELFLANYNLCICDKVIEPLQTEIYFYKEGLYEDKTMHKRPQQKCNYGKLYIHTKGRGGVDICLSDSKEYFLSILLKTSRIGDKYFKQTKLASELDKFFYDEINNLKLKKKIKVSPIYKTKRVGIQEKNDVFLGAIIEIENKNAKFAFTKGLGKEQIVCSKFFNQSDKIKKYLGYIPKKIIESIKNMSISAFLLITLTGCYKTIEYVPNEQDKIDVENKITFRYEKEKLGNEFIENRVFPDKTCNNTISLYIKENLNCKTYEVISFSERYRYAGAIRCDYNIICNRNNDKYSDYKRLKNSYWIYKDENKSITSTTAPLWLKDCVYCVNKFNSDWDYDDKYQKCESDDNSKVQDDTLEETKKCLIKNGKTLEKLKQNITKEENDKANKEYEKKGKSVIAWGPTIFLSPLWIPTYTLLFILHGFQTFEPCCG